MATYTDNYSLIKPTMAELADIRTINGNMDAVDEILHGAQVSIAPGYDPNETYNDGDRCMHDYMLYECDYDNITGAWDASKWHRVYASETGGGGGQTYNDFTGATASTAGAHGLVPAPLAGDQDKFLKADGTWAEVTGGGSGSGGISYTTLYSGSTDVQTVNLTAPLSDFDLILIRGNSTGSTPYVIENIYMADGLVDTDVIGASDDSDFLWYTISNSLQTLTKATANNYILAEVVGMKIHSGGASTIIEESVQIAGGAAAYSCTNTIRNYDLIGFVFEGASEIHWTSVDKTASKDCYIGDISNVNSANQYALTEGKIVVDAVNNTVENVYSTMFHYDGSSYQNTYRNRRIVKLYFAKISGGGSNQKTYLVEGVGKNAGTVAAGGFKDVATGVYVDSADEEYIGYLMRYSGNPHLVISNVWIGNDLQINVTLFNPTGTSYSVDSATGIYFTVITRIS